MDNVKGAGAQMKRRTVVKGAAWAAPVVTMGVAAPAQAASPPPIAPTLTEGEFCKHTKGVKRYHVGVTWENTLNCDTTVTITSITVSPNSGTHVTVVVDPSTFSVGGKLTESFVYHSNESGDIANGTVTVTYTYTDCSGETVTATVPLTAPDLPPCTVDYPA